MQASNHRHRRRRSGAQPTASRSGGAFAGAVLALGVLAIVDNVVFHWWLGFHRFNERWSNQANTVAEVLLVVLGVAMVVWGVRALRR